EEVLAATSLVREGRIIVLGQTLGTATPVPPHRKRFERYMTRDGGDYLAGARRPGGFQFAEDVLSLASHTGTHIDSLAHAWYDDMLFNRHDARTVRSTTGAGRCGADKIGPIVTRGVLLDLAVGSSLPPGTALTDADLRAAAEAADVVLQPGDAVLL